MDYWIERARNKKKIAEFFSEQQRKEFKANVKFGDIILNHCASDRNPNKYGYFVCFCERQGIECVELTNGQGFKYFPIFNKDSKLEIIGSIKDEPTTILDAPA